MMDGDFSNNEMLDKTNTRSKNLYFSCCWWCRCTRRARVRASICSWRRSPRPAPRPSASWRRDTSARTPGAAPARNSSWAGNCGWPANIFPLVQIFLWDVIHDLVSEGGWVVLGLPVSGGDVDGVAVGGEGPVQVDHVVCHHVGNQNPSTLLTHTFTFTCVPHNYCRQGGISFPI